MDTFVPHLSLCAEPDGEFSLFATTVVPSPCFGSGPATPDVPPANVRLTREAFPVRLSLFSYRMICVPRPTLRVHRLTNLDLRGRTSIYAYAQLGNDVLGVSNVGVESVAPIPKNPVVIESSDWHCWVLPTPEGPMLHVGGLLFTPTPGYSVSLQRTSPQGINPKELLLDAVVVPLAGNAWPPVVTPHSVRFETRGDYDGVLIREPDGDAIHLVVSTDR